MRHQLTTAKPRQQQGMVLIVALIILLVLTILGVSGMSTSSMQERMAANEHDRQIAFQAAEAALRAGESNIKNNIPNSSAISSWFSITCDNKNYPGFCDASSATTNYPVYWTDKNLQVWAKSSRHVTVKTALGTAVAEQPMYIIEFLGWVLPPGVTGRAASAAYSDPMMFRVTAMGFGQSPNAKVMLQSTYKKY